MTRRDPSPGFPTPCSAPQARITGEAPAARGGMPLPAPPARRHVAMCTTGIDIRIGAVI